MKHNPLLSVIILTKNEEHNIKECIQSVNFADEIVVIDDNSTDDTAKIAQSMGAVIYTRSLDDFASQRNYGLSKARGEWILFVDADERVSTKLRDEIINVIGKERNVYYKIPRKNKIFGKYLKHTDWYPDFQFRLFTKDNAKWDRKVHEQLKTNLIPKEVNAELLHENYQTIDQFIQKNFGHYADYEVQLLADQGYTFIWTDLIRKPFGEFLRRYFASEGYKDGLHGFVASVMVSFSVFIVYVKVWEKEHFKEREIPLSQIADEFEKTGNDLRHWLRNESVKGERNKLIKFIKKVLV